VITHAAASADQPQMIAAHQVRVIALTADFLLVILTAGPRPAHEVLAGADGLS